MGVEKYHGNTARARRNSKWAGVWVAIHPSTWWGICPPGVSMICQGVGFRGHKFAGFPCKNLAVVIVGKGNNGLLGQSAKPMVCVRPGGEGAGGLDAAGGRSLSAAGKRATTCFRRC